MTIDSLTAALLAGLGTVSSALAWMTIGRFQDREKYVEKVTQLHAEYSKSHEQALERIFTLAHEQSVAAAAHAAALHGLKEQVIGMHDATDDLTAAVNGIVRDVIRDARAGRRTVSDTTMQAVQATVERALEQASERGGTDRKRGGGR